MKAFIDVDWVGSVGGKKSTSGGAFFLGKWLVSWTSKKQNSISQSTVEVEYVTAIVNCSNFVWFKHLLAGMKVEIKDLVVIFCDNTIVINISKNIVMYTKKKHISIKYHFLRKLVQDKEEELGLISKRKSLLTEGETKGRRSLHW